jgi:hypothetical protein
MSLKIAICLSGLTRHHSNCLTTIEKHFKNHNVDIFCHSYEVKDADKIVRDAWSKRITKEYYQNLNLSIAEVLSLFNPKEFIIEEYDAIAEHLVRIFLEIVNIKGVAIDPLGGNSTISMHYSLMMSNHLRRLYQDRTKAEYDVVFRMRYDSEVLHMLDLENYDLSKLNIPYGLDWEGGVNDQFAFGPPDLMDKYMDLFPSIVDTAKQCLKLAPEILFKQHLENHDLISRLIRPAIVVKTSFSREHLPEIKTDTHIVVQAEG